MRGGLRSRSKTSGLRSSRDLSVSLSISGVLKDLIRLRCSFEVLRAEF